MMQIPQWIISMGQQVDSWAQQQRSALTSSQSAGWPPWRWQLKLPWYEDKRRKEELQEEYKIRKQQIEDLTEALKVEDLSDLQDVLGAMVLSECAYKRPESEVLRAVNSIKTDFGGQLISLYRLQATLEHVPHRYILAESGETLFAAFSGTKHYRDYLTDANILQGALFHDDDNESDNSEGELENNDKKSSGSVNAKPAGLGTDLSRLPVIKAKSNGHKPAAHRGFLARARGIPAVELYRLAQKKDVKLVLCGHSLGGAVAVLATLAILRVFSTPSITKAGGRLHVKCITFSQPPVGNAALRDYVHQKGWQQHFRSYCIPEDLVPRILSPAYFQHYRTQVPPVAVAGSAEGSKDHENGADTRVETKVEDSKTVESDRMVLGLGPLPKYLWRLPKLAPLVGTPRFFQRSKMQRTKMEDNSGHQVSNTETDAEVTPMEIQEDTNGVALTPLLSDSNVKSESSVGSGKVNTALASKDGAVVPYRAKEGKNSNGTDWLKRVPSLPSYVPFGELYLLERSSVEPLSASEYTQLTSVQSVLQELKERLQSHTMRSYRTRFKRIYDDCVYQTSTSPSLRMEHLPHLPHLQQWLGILGARVAESGSISEPMVLRTATALVPLGWTGIPGDKEAKPLIVDVQGFNLHLCTLVRAQVNGRWCSTTVESLPPPPFAHQDLQHVQPKLQKMCLRIGPPLDNPSQKSKPGSEEAAVQGNRVANSINTFTNKVEVPKFGRTEYGMCEMRDFGEVTLHCSTDFMSTSQVVIARMRRVRLLGLEGAGKTSLYCALLGEAGRTVQSSDGGVLPDMDWREGVAGGINYVDAAGVNLQDLPNEAQKLRQELAVSSGQFGNKLDLIILVHNLGHKIPQLRDVVDPTHPRPALALLLDEVAAAGIPLVLAITNKFSVSADRRYLAAMTVMNTYKVPSNLTVVINSCPHTVHGVADDTLEIIEVGNKVPNLSGVQGAAQRLFSGPMKLVPRPFRKREVVLPSEGVKKLKNLVHSVLSAREEEAYEELAKEQLALQTAEELVQAARETARLGFGKSGAAAAAAVGAALGAGLGVFVAIAVGAASALRKP